ncbi:MAG: AMIN domain-containing protein [Candidatus Sericytochromatia bacterium]|nr:AMIN domain-containing protein [Candidatus Sericytochromatia bacterium]
MLFSTFRPFWGLAFVGLWLAILGSPADSARRAATAPSNSLTSAQRTVLVRGMHFDKVRHTVSLRVTGQVSISTRTVSSPTRLVVDLTRARLVTPNREMVVRDPLIKRIRIAQFSLTPPVVRLVIEPRISPEPTLAVQQTGRAIFVSVARAQPASNMNDGLPPDESFESPESPVDGDSPQQQALPERRSPSDNAPRGSGTIRSRLLPPPPETRPEKKGGNEPPLVEQERNLHTAPTGQGVGVEKVGPLRPAVTEPVPSPSPLTPEPVPSPSPLTPEPEVTPGVPENVPGVPVLPPDFDPKNPSSGPVSPGMPPEKTTSETSSETVPGEP